MTPLEEIEQALKRVNEEYDGQPPPESIGPLYQSRAIERLEATVRAIGVHFQNAADHLPPYSDESGPERDRPGCYECRELLGAQHKPSCSRQGFVSMRSVSR